MNNIVEQVKNLLDQFDLVNRTEDNILNELRPYVCNELLKISQVDNDTTEEIYVLDSLKPYIEKVLENPELSGWFLANHAEEDQVKLLEQFTEYCKMIKVIPLELEQLSGAYIGDPLRQFIYFNTTKGKTQLFLNQFIDSIGLRQKLQEMRAPFTLDVQDMKGLFLMNLMLQCVSEKAQEAFEQQNNQVDMNIRGIK